MENIISIINKMEEIDKRCESLKYQRDQIDNFLNNFLRFNTHNSMSLLEINIVIAAIESYEKESRAIVKEIEDLKVITNNF